MRTHSPTSQAQVGAEVRLVQWSKAVGGRDLHHDGAHDNQIARRQRAVPVGRFHEWRRLPFVSAPAALLRRQNVQLSGEPGGL